MARIRVFPYSLASNSAKVISNKLSALLDVPVLRIRPDERSSFTPNDGDVIINWGKAAIPSHWHIANRNIKIFNKPSGVSIARDKLKTFETLKDSVNNTYAIPKFYSNEYIELVKEQLPLTYVSGVAPMWLARTLLTSSQGRGIVPLHIKDDIIRAPLYTKYLPIEAEYRAHVIGSELVLLVQKARSTDNPIQNVEGNARWVRNHGNGWIFIRNFYIDEERRNKIKQAAIDAVARVGLDFGAVDIIVTTETELPVVLEINTAPGLVNSTIDDYGNGLCRLIQQHIG